ncbi:hypothetical protein RGCCGE502_28433 (plasmid) [Rhizobium grahamii CCGE 502]|uniref:Uncharacterized protein n=2 Tax=Rhizobium grahamii TaxID=1120045 RepID=S3H6H0_9HYPH|nr:hypothetical protein RGCCGE502_28433 [Rhizobium grahamii CCGE 502]
MKSLGWGTEEFWSDAKQNSKVHITAIRIGWVVIEARLSGREPDLEQTPGKDTRRNEKRKSALVTVSVLATVFGLGCIYGGILLMAAPGVGATSFMMSREVV